MPMAVDSLRRVHSFFKSLEGSRRMEQREQFCAQYMLAGFPIRAQIIRRLYFRWQMEQP